MADARQRHSQRPNRLPCLSRDIHVAIGCNADVMSYVINHVACGDVSVNNDNFEPLLLAADMLQIPSLTARLCKYLETQLSVENCIAVVKFTSNFCLCESTKLKGTQFFLDHFTKVVETSPDFARLTIDEVAAVLRADRLHVVREEEVLAGAATWLAGRRYSGEDVATLVSCVRIGLLSPDGINAIFDKWSPHQTPPLSQTPTTSRTAIKNHTHTSNHLPTTSHKPVMSHMTTMSKTPGNNQILKKRNTLKNSHMSYTRPRSSAFDDIMYMVLLQLDQMHNIDPSRFLPRLPRDILIAVGGSNIGHPLSIVEAYDCRAQTWTVVPSDDFAPRSYFGMCALDNCLWVVGGFGEAHNKELSSVIKFDAEARHWTPQTSMNERRCFVGCTSLCGVIYAVGGHDGTRRLDTAESLCQGHTTWQHITPMLQKRSDAGVAGLNGYLYVCGGFDGIRYLHSVERYAPCTGTWEALAGMGSARSGMGLLAYNDSLYALGGCGGALGGCYGTMDGFCRAREGFDRGRDGCDVYCATRGECDGCEWAHGVRLRSFEKYEPEQNEWRPLTSMWTPRSNLGVCVLEGALYAMGGYDGNSTTARVECYDFATSTWFTGPPRMNHKRSALRVHLLGSLTNTAALLGR